MSYRSIYQKDEHSAKLRRVWEEIQPYNSEKRYVRDVNFVKLSLWSELTDYRGKKIWGNEDVEVVLRNFRGNRLGKHPGITSNADLRCWLSP